MDPAVLALVALVGLIGFGVGWRAGSDAGYRRARCMIAEARAKRREQRR